MKRTKSAGAQFLLGTAQGRFIFCGDASRKNCKGLPDRHARLLVLREAMSFDSADQAGVYFGTFTGQFFYTRDEGREWNLLAAFLPPLYSVEAFGLPA